MSEALDAIPLETAAEATAGDVPLAENSPPPENAETGEVQPPEAGFKNERPAEGGEAEASGDVHFHKRPEWQELDKVLGAEAPKVRPILRKLFEREAQMHTRLKEATPAVQTVQELRKLTGDQAGFDKMLSLVRGYASNLAHENMEALPVLEFMVQDLRARATGDGKLDEDLQTQVDGQIIDSDTAAKWQADRRALASIKAEQARRAEQNAPNPVIEAISQWESNARKAYPDFGEVTAVDDPRLFYWEK
jgi:hypothetical protein